MSGWPYDAIVELCALSREMQEELADDNRHTCTLLTVEGWEERLRGCIARLRGERDEASIEPEGEDVELAPALVRRFRPERLALRELKLWGQRGHAEARFFQVQYLGGIKHPWNVRVENEPTSWSHHEDTHSTLAAAVIACLEAAEKEGHP